MKKIISSLFISFVLVSACGKKDDKNVKPISDEPVFLVGIGKVLPDGGIVELSINGTGKVVKIHKKLGDEVQEGEVILELEAINEKLSVDQAKASLNSASQSVNALMYDVQAAEVKLASFKREYETSKKLYSRKAETQQKVFQDSIAYAEQLAVVNRQKQNLKAQQVSLKEQQLAVKSNEVLLQDKNVKALQNGALIRFDVAIGQVLAPNVSFGELAPATQLVIEGELDELYANRLKVGQQVDVVLVGQIDVVAKGKIRFVGSSLQNKSILYESVGEGTDRRVRRFTVELNDGVEQLLINQKVECKIKL